jgi:serine/threonine protein kinase
VAGPTTAGRRLGRYHLADPLGGGPCGAVYRAKVYGVAGFERQFAVKRFHPELVALPVVSQRLSQAARAYGSLEHPRIARLHEYGVAGGEVFTATEMVSGLDVMRLIAATHGSGVPLPPGAALSLVTQAARAIGYAHGRGVNHLGLCPTNLIVTPEGDVKLTDVGIFAQTMTIRASDDTRLKQRIHYLAPEQLIHEGTSAASDVFALGALIHELVTGERAFVGVTPLDVEHAILSGHVRDSGLPKPMARVLARCFARSPFERFPDARALADAIDAALRVSPVVGGRRELGGIVKEAVVRLEQMNEGQLSGAMAIAMPMPPTPSAAVRMAVATGAAPPSAAPNPMAQTMRGSAPAPGMIAQPRRNPPTRPPPIAPPSVIPSIPPRLAISKSVAPPPIPMSRTDEDSDERTIARDSSRPSSTSSPQLSPTPGPLPSTPPRMPNASPLPFHTPSEPIPEHIDHHASHAPLRLDTAWPTGEQHAIPDGAVPLAEPDDDEPVVQVIDDDSEGVPVMPPMSRERPSVPPPYAEQLPAPEPAPRKKSGFRPMWTAVFLVLCAGLGIGGVLAWNTWFRDQASDAAASPGEPDVVAKQEEKEAPPPVEPEGVKPDEKDDPTPEVKDEPAPEVKDEVVPPTPPAPTDDGVLLIESDPPGATVYVDGAEQGETPVKLPASADRHSIAIVMAGHALHTAEIDGSGTHKAVLPEVDPPNGPAGIKVRCKDKNRYYVFVDGAATGQFCPTERIGVEVGPHTVEVYDLVSETRRSIKANVKGTRNSVRVRVD